MDNIKFPLFDKLYNKINKNPDKYELTNDMYITIGTLSQKDTDNIYYIIMHYKFIEDTVYYKLDKNTAFNNIQPQKYNRIRKTTVYILPYEGKTFGNGKGCIYDIDNIPKYLQKLISAYLHEIII